MIFNVLYVLLNFRKQFVILNSCVLDGFFALVLTAECASAVNLKYGSYSNREAQMASLASYYVRTCCVHTGRVSWSRDVH